MQEKSALVFVAATANRIQLLPAEVIRKGRFDQVFFVDLPNEDERKQIFTIHLAKNRCDPAKFDLVFLAKATKGWNGAEIEQIVVSSVVDAYPRGSRPRTTCTASSPSTVPSRSRWKTRSRPSRAGRTTGH
jgi:SpoVK/Ycf46/Vps4 family AAA+-type ATPase